MVTCCATGADYNVIGGQLFWRRQPKVACLLIVQAPWPHISLHLLMLAVGRTHEMFHNRDGEGEGGRGTGG